MPDLHEDWTRVYGALRELRRLISDRDRLRYYDESLDANESEIALHALCHFLLQPGVPAVTNEELGEIERLHTLMDIDDDCVTKLRQKRSGL